MQGARAPSTTLTNIDMEAMKVRKLAKSKRFALSFLIVACVIFITLTFIDPHHDSVLISLLVTMSEAAMVGGLADWFAVTALFRHPVGQRWIPHTAIIPKNKDQIGKSLADFICDRILDSESVLERIRRLNLADYIAKTMANPAHAAKIADFVVRYAPHLVDVIDSKDLQEFVQISAKEKFIKLDISSLLASLLKMLTKGGRNNVLLDILLNDISALAEDPSTRRVLVNRISDQVPTILRSLGLKVKVSNYVAEKVVSSLRDLIYEASNDKNHEIRVALEEKALAFVNRLEVDDDLREKVAAFCRNKLSDKELSGYVKDIWDGTIKWLRNDLASPSSSIREKVQSASLNLGLKLESSPEVKRWLNDWVLSALIPLIEDYREKIRWFINDRVKAWSPDDLTKQLEMSVGSDLQSIRISGTLVGAVIGGLLFGLMHLIRIIAG